MTQQLAVVTDVSWLAAGPRIIKANRSTQGEFVWLCSPAGDDANGGAGNGLISVRNAMLGPDAE